MGRFDVCADPFASERVHPPFLQDVQNDHLGPLAKRVVIPLRSPEGYGTPARGLNPRIDVQRMPWWWTLRPWHLCPRGCWASLCNAPMPPALTSSTPSTPSTPC